MKNYKDFIKESFFRKKKKVSFDDLKDLIYSNINIEDLIHDKEKSIKYLLRESNQVILIEDVGMRKNIPLDVTDSTNIESKHSVKVTLHSFNGSFIKGFHCSIEYFMETFNKKD